MAEVRDGARGPQGGARHPREPWVQLDSLPAGQGSAGKAAKHTGLMD